MKDHEKPFGAKTFQTFDYKKKILNGWWPQKIYIHCEINTSAFSIRIDHLKSIHRFTLHEFNSSNEKIPLVKNNVLIEIETEKIKTYIQIELSHIPTGCTKIKQYPV